MLILSFGNGWEANTKSFLTANRQILQISTFFILLFPWGFTPFFRDFFSVFGLIISVAICTGEMILNLDKEMHLIKKTRLLKIEHTFILLQILLTRVFYKMAWLTCYKACYPGHHLCTLLLLSGFWHLLASHLYLIILLPPMHMLTINPSFLFFLTSTKALFNKAQIL